MFRKDIIENQKINITMAKENQNETRTSIDELNDTLTNAVEQKLQNNKKSSKKRV